MRLSLESPNAGALVVPFAGAAPRRRQRSDAGVLPGSENTANGQSGPPGNLGDPAVSTAHRRRSGWPPHSTPRPGGGASAAARERSPDATVVPSMPKETKPRPDGRREV